MIGRLFVAALTTVIVALPFGSTSADVGVEDSVFRRDEEANEVIVSSNDDDDGDSRDSTDGTDNDSGPSGATGDSQRSKDATGSRETRVSRGDDRSRGDLTRDQTNDGPGGLTRDRSAGHTNDVSRNDTR